MPIPTLEEFCKVTEEECLRKAGSAAAHCCKCKVLLQESITGNRWTAYGRMCSDCYFGKVGEVVDRHPVGVPRPRGG